MSPGTCRPAAEPHHNSAPQADNDRVNTTEAETYRREILGYCYRYFGCIAEAEDATQETMLRAWRARDGAEFGGRSSLRTWLYSIATHVCLDMARAPQRRSLPVDLNEPGRVPDDPTSLATMPEQMWIGPASDAHLGVDPSATALARESVRLAFVAALQFLPPRQRVVLILRDVLVLSAAECADLLDMSVASVNSALARARKTMAQHGATLPTDTADDAPAYDTRLLEKYVAAFEAYDVDRLVDLLTEDAEFSMPPFELWLRGPAQIERWWRGPGQVCRNSRTIVTSANGRPAVAVYHDGGGRDESRNDAGVRDSSAARWEPFAIHVLESRAGRLSALTHFIGAGHFAEFGLPAHLP
ncbi:MAG: RNA polymerase subunit sigma-70 [Dietzia sp.]|uniref:RNA polymerase subunit sigma-70 n=1 Tax=Dietzia TaxID=37914 RepID=UPI0015FA0836|nr:MULTISPECIES: RNA polymerase subunit sigma-70 [Dietzia]MBB1048112.1 sigma-70 family RNA polymerase sigma factor [Dietzia cercidiphylli]MBB1054603.1 sigma-70 family RNA polymerase sigma factor [Dietzia sp. B44]MBC7297068.1 RNA polymerase subunit sigma-70 [Dietzia sp.]MDO8394022.1 RNA polymerase subunit sigma-70 [Dietzia sp.]